MMIELKNDMGAKAGFRGVERREGEGESEVK